MIDVVGEIKVEVLQCSTVLRSANKEGHVLVEVQDGRCVVGRECPET